MPDVSVVVQAVVSGLSAGAAIGLVAMGITLVAGTARVLPLHAGDLVVAAAVGPALLVVGTAPVAGLLPPGTAAALVAGALLAGAVLSAAVVRLAVLPHLPDERRGRPADVVGWVAATVVAGLLLREGLSIVLPRGDYAAPDALGLERLGALDVAGARLPGRLLVVLATALALAVLVERVVVRSRRGRVLRAVADDPGAAALCGVDARRALLAAAALAGLLAGAAAVLVAPSRALSPDDGVLLGLAGFAAALLGGLGSLRGAVAGGLAVGLLQSAAVQTGVLAPWSDVVPLVLLLAVLVVRPGRVHPGPLR